MIEVPAYAIGLPEEWVAEIKKRAEVRHIAMSDVVPRLFASEGKTFIESPQTPGRYLQPKCVLWYGYFPDATYARKALAVSNTPTFPNIRRTLPWDDKTMAVIMAQEVDHPVNRGFRPPLGLGEFYPAPSWPPNTVLKWGNSHCGEDKQLLVTGQEPVEDGTHNLLSEPFVEGHSIRILVVGDNQSAWYYQSKDWRKNVNGKIHREPLAKNPHLLRRTQVIMQKYGLQIAGVDFVGDTLLEVNTYPSLDECAEARELFLFMAADMVRHTQHL